MQDLLVKGPGFHEGGPQNQSKIAESKPVRVIDRQNYEFLDQSDQVLLKVVEDRLPTPLALRFPLLQDHRRRLQQVWVSKLIGSVYFVALVAVKENLLIQKFLNGIVLIGEVIEIAVEVRAPLIWVVCEDIDLSRHIFEIFKICIS